MFTTTEEKESSLEEYLDNSNKDRDMWVEDIVFTLYGRSQTKEISKKINRKIFKKIVTIAHIQGEISNAIVFLNTLLDHFDCSKEEILGAAQLVLMNKIEQGKKVNIQLTAKLENLIKICNEVINRNKIDPPSV